MSEAIFDFRFEICDLGQVIAKRFALPHLAFNLPFFQKSQIANLKSQI
jgi:hypothetical protein